MGFEPVGQVMGTSIRTPLRKKHVQCGSYSHIGLIRRRLDPYDRVLKALVAECVALDAEGVIGITVTTRDLSIGIEYVAFGTAVRSATGRTEKPFLAHLSGQDFARLVVAGWIPVGIARATSLLAVHGVRPQGNGRSELGWQTEALARSKDLARRDLVTDIARWRGEGFVMATRWSRHHERDCEPRGSADIVAESFFLGTAISPLPAAVAPSKALTIMRLT
ncbi:hypothetical protein ACIBH1_01325 [Nonomuraea sp. NPDC050663]|uniref:hypothetical protein n=1 Tax=Nonomuraea sp. NPDC050663 TaxID=3364370 RepID=UPI0037AE203E